MPSPSSPQLESIQNIQIHQPRNPINSNRKSIFNNHNQNTFIDQQHSSIQSHHQSSGLQPLSIPIKTSMSMDNPDHPHSRQSYSSHSTTNSQTPPSSWAQSGKLVRKKASGLFREAARSWGRSKSKEVLSLGIGALIGNNNNNNNTNDSSYHSTPPPPDLNQQSPISSSHHSLSPSLLQSSPVGTISSQPKHLNGANPNPLLIKPIKKRICSLQPGSKKLKAKDQASSSLNRRSEIGFGDWADTLNTAVATSSPRTPVLPSRPDHDLRTLSTSNHPSNMALVSSDHQRSRASLLIDDFASPSKRPESCHSSTNTTPSAIRRRDRSLSHARNSALSSSHEVEPVSSISSSRVPRSTFPHVPRSPRSPRSPRRSYNTRATAQRSSALQTQHDLPAFIIGAVTSTPNFPSKSKFTPGDTQAAGLSQYQQPAPMTSSPFKRSVSPINHFNSHFDLESPIASKSAGHIALPPMSQSTHHVNPSNPTPIVPMTKGLPPSPSKLRMPHTSASLRLRSASSARANLFGAKPNQSGGFEPFSAPVTPLDPYAPDLVSSESTTSSLMASSGCVGTNAQQQHFAQTWLSTSLIPNQPESSSSSNHVPGPPRSRQRTVSVTLKEHPNRAGSYGLGPLPEHDHDSGHESDDLNARYAFSQSSPSSRSCNGMVRVGRSGSPVAGPIRRASAGSVKGCSTLSRRDGSSASNHKSSYLNPLVGGGSTGRRTKTARDRDTSTDIWAVPQLEGLGMTLRHQHSDDSCQDLQMDEIATQAGSSKPSSSHSLLSISRTSSQDPFRTISSCASQSFLRSSGLGIDGFGALPPPESPFPGHHRSQQLSLRSSGLPSSPNKLKRDSEGAMVTSLPQPPPMLRPRSSAHHPSSSHHLRSRADSLTPLQRDSWGPRSVDASEEDDEENEMVIHHDRDHINGSLESHEGLSNLSVPGLTDSSSLASSLASSSQSITQVHSNDRAGQYRPASWEKLNGDAARDPKRRSLPTHVGPNSHPHCFAHLPPSPFTAPNSMPLTHKSSSFFAQPPLKPLSPPPVTIPTSFTADQDDDGGSFHDSKPEASAFLSSTMTSKRCAMREKRRQQLGIPSPFVKYAMTGHLSDTSINGQADGFNSSFDDSLAMRSMRQALGGPKLIEAAIQADEKDRNEHLQSLESSLSMQAVSNQSISFNSSISSPFLSTADMFSKRPSLSSLRMPDTPIKKPHFLHKATHLHHHTNKPFVSSGLSKQAAVSSAFDSPEQNSSCGNSPSTRNVNHVDSYCSKSNAQGSSIRTPILGQGAFDSPSASMMQMANAESPGVGSPSALVNFKKSPLFRRRSSDAVLTKSGGERSRGSLAMEDPGTPTKVAPGWINRGSQLLTSPGNSISSATSSPVLPPFQAHTQFERQVPDFLKDPQVTPSRPNGRLFTTFAPPSTFQPLITDSTDLVNSRPFSPSQRPGFKSRHSSAEIRANAMENEHFGPPSSNKFENEFDLVEQIGNGEFGEVFKARHSSTGVVYAVKRAKKPVGGPKAMSRQMEEVELLKQLTTGPNRSPYIIQFHDAWQHNYHLHIQTEYCSNGTLETFLELVSAVQPRLDEERIWKIMSELSQAVHFIHSAGMLHLDVKPANVFVTEYGGLKIGDFGIGMRWPRIDPKEVFRDWNSPLVGSRYPVYSHLADPHLSAEERAAIPTHFLRYIDIRDQDERKWKRLKNCGRFIGFDLEREGDREYIAPEILSGRYGDSADVFAIGLIGLEMITNVNLPDNGDEWRALRSNDFSRIDLSGLSSEIVVLLKRLLEMCPDKRITSDELVRHPIFIKLAELRERGYRREEAGTQEEVELEAIEEDTEMQSSEDADEEEKFLPFQRPRAPTDGNWTIARGAILPEAKGFLEFILTGEDNTPEKVRPLRRQKRRVLVDDNQMDLDV
ncbi:WEE protein kinase [Melampsora americana]|nr:WEE protein kinase [Melampsora americana]